jgi:DNA-binding NarL/FixJ family response regulator
MSTAPPPRPLLVTDAHGIVTAATSTAQALLGTVVGDDCGRAVRAVAKDGRSVCALCQHHHLATDEDRDHTGVIVRGETVDLRCAAVGDTRVIEVVPTEEAPERKPLLSPREREVLVLVARGLTNERIANRLGVSASTVRSHMEHLLEKLEVHTRSQAVARALSLGEIE